MTRKKRRIRVEAKVEARRQKPQPLLLALLLLIPLLLWSRMALAGDWPQFRGNPQNTGQAAGGFSLDPKPQWSFETGAAVESTAAIVAAVVYVASMDGYLYSLNLKDGSLRWKFNADAEIKSSPSVYQDQVWFGDENGILHVLAAADGKLIRSFEAGGALVSSPNFQGDAVFFGGYDNNLYALSKADGHLLWKLETDGYVHATPGLSDRYLVVGGCDSYLRILDPVSGKETGKEPLELGGYVAGSPLIHQGRAYVPTFENQVLCVDLSQRRVIWRYEHPEKKFPFYSSPALAEDLLFVGGRDKMLHAIDLASGKGRWTFSVKSKIDSSPVVVGQHLLFADLAGELFLLEQKTGKKVWQYDTGSGTVASPAVADGRMVIGLDNGMVLCFQ